MCLIKFAVCDYHRRDWGVHSCASAHEGGVYMCLEHDIQSGSQGFCLLQIEIIPVNSSHVAAALCSLSKS